MPPPHAHANRKRGSSRVSLAAVRRRHADDLQSSSSNEDEVAAAAAATNFRRRPSRMENSGDRPPRTESFSDDDDGGEVAEPPRPGRMKLADVIDSINCLDVVIGSGRPTGAPSLETEERSSSFPRRSSRSPPSVFGRETRKRLSSSSPSKSCPSTSEAGRPTGMAKWRYPTHKSFIVDMNNPPDYKKNVSPTTTTTTKAASEAEVASEAAKVSPVQASDRPAVPPPAPPGRGCGSIYYPTSSPFRKQVQRDADASASSGAPKPRRFGSKLRLGLLCAAVVLGVILYFSLLGELIAVRRVANAIRKAQEEEEDCSGTRDAPN